MSLESRRKWRITTGVNSVYTANGESKVNRTNVEIERYGELTCRTSGRDHDVRRWRAGGKVAE